MRRRNEVLVGLLTLVALAVLVTGMLWLARGGLSRGYPLYARFAWGAGLKQGQPVLFSGVVVGYVDQVDLLENGGLVVTMRIYKKQRVPTGTVAAIEPNGIFGDMLIALRAKGPTGHMMQPDDTLLSAPGTAQLSDYLVRFDSLQRSLMELVRGVHSELIDQHGIASIRDAAKSAQELFTHIEAVAVEQNKQLTETQVALRKAASSVDSVKIDSVLKSVRESAGHLNSLAEDLRATNTRISGILTKAETGGGSVSRLLNDSTAYTNVIALEMHLDSLMADVKANPKKYLTICVQIFRKCN